METILDHHRQATPQPTPLGFLRRFPDAFIQYFDDAPSRDPRKAASVDHLSPAEAARKQAAGCGVYFTPNAFVVARRLKYLERIQAVFLDVDCVKEGQGREREEIERRKRDALLRLVGSRMPPHSITETKNGLQPIWRVHALEVERGLLLFRQAMEALLRTFQGDPGAKDPTRVLRLPGYLHLKNPEEPFLCRLVWNELDREPEEIEAIIREFYVPPEPRRPSVGTPRPPASPSDLLDVADVIREAAREAGMTVTFHRNSDGSLQIIEDGVVTSGFISARGNFCYSSSGKPRKGGPVQLVGYYLGLEPEDSRRWLAERLLAGAPRYGTASGSQQGRRG